MIERNSKRGDELEEDVSIDSGSLMDAISGGCWKKYGVIPCSDEALSIMLANSINKLFVSTYEEFSLSEEKVVSLDEGDEVKKDLKDCVEHMQKDKELSGQALEFFKSKQGINIMTALAVSFPIAYLTTLTRMASFGSFVSNKEVISNPSKYFDTKMLMTTMIKRMIINVGCAEIFAKIQKEGGMSPTTAATIMASITGPLITATDIAEMVYARAKRAGEAVPKLGEVASGVKARFGSVIPGNMLKAQAFWSLPVMARKFKEDHELSGLESKAVSGITVASVAIIAQHSTCMARELVEGRAASISGVFQRTARAAIDAFSNPAMRRPSRSLATAMLNAGAVSLATWAYSEDAKERGEKAGRF